MAGLARRTVLMSATILGAGMLAACTGARSTDGRSNAPSGTQSSSSGTGAAAARGDQYGVGVYNTQQVADELQWIEANVTPRSDRDWKRILVTGSTGGAGQLAAAYLAHRGHTVVAHARNAQRAAEVRRDVPGLEDIVVGDLLDLDQTRTLADSINALGTFDVIIHNAGEYGLSDDELVNANSISPYLLTALVTPPKQLAFLSSDQHLGGDLKLDAIRDGGGITYSDSKLHMAMIAMAVAQRRPDRQANAVAPGWIPTLMGFHNGNATTPDNLRDGYMTQVRLAEAVDSPTGTTGEFLFHQKVETQVNDLVHDTQAQDDLMAAYAASTGVTLS